MWSGTKKRNVKPELVVEEVGDAREKTWHFGTSSLGVDKSKILYTIFNFVMF